MAADGFRADECGKLGRDYVRRAAEGRVTEAGVTITWSEGQASALDVAQIGEGRDVGSLRVEPSGDVDLCWADPGFDVDPYVSTGLRQ